MAAPLFSICTVANDLTQLARMSTSLEASFQRSKNLAEGVAYELLSIDGNCYDLFKGYNKAIRDAKGKYLVFVHQDVEFLSNIYAWVRIHNLLKKPTTGAVGVAGTRVLDGSGIWWQSASKDGSGAVTHGNEHGKEWTTCFGVYGQTVVLDGVCFMARKDVLEEIGGFNADDFSGFHYYDIDTTLRIHLAGYKNYTIPLMIKHHSVGDVTSNSGWYKNRGKFLQIWRNHLPISL